MRDQTCHSSSNADVQVTTEQNTLLPGSVQTCDVRFSGAVCELLTRDNGVS